MNTKTKTKDVKTEKSVGEAEALLLKLRRRLCVPRHGLPYLVFGMESPLRKTVPVQLVRDLAKFKVIGKNIMVKATEEVPLSQTKMTLKDAVAKLRENFGSNVRLSEISGLLNTKATARRETYRKATPEQLEEYTKARRALDISLLKTAATLYKETLKLNARYAAGASAKHSEFCNRTEAAAEKVNLIENLLKEYK